eukprot:1860433-Pleurochrysis_carterae.AAC.6
MDATDERAVLTLLCSEPKHMGISWSRSSSSSSSSQLLVCIACSATALALLALPRPRYTPEAASFSRSHLDSEPSWPSLHSLPSLKDAQILNWTQSFPSERSSPSLPSQVFNQSPDEEDHSSIHRISHLRFAVDNAKHSGRRERGGYTFWSTDFHIAPVGDMAEVFRSLCQDFGLCMKLVENSFSGACASTFGGRKSSCAHDLHVLNQANAFDLCPRCENDIFTIPNCEHAGCAKYLWACQDTSPCIIVQLAGFHASESQTNCKRLRFCIPIGQCSMPWTQHLLAESFHVLRATCLPCGRAVSQAAHTAPGLLQGVPRRVVASQTR